MKRRPKPPVPEVNPAADAAAILLVKFWLTGISPMVWCFQGLEQSRQGRRASRLMQGGQIGRFGSARTARQSPQRGGRQIGGRRQAQAVPANSIDTLQMPQQLRRRAALRRCAQIVKRVEPVIIGCNQRDEFLALVVGQSVGQAMPKPQRRAMAYTADQAFERRDAGQQNLVRQQPGGRSVKQQSWAIIAGPAQHVEPAGQPEAGGLVLLKFAEPVALSDRRRMPPALPPVAIGVQTWWRHFSQLTRHGRDHRGRCQGRIVEKGAEETRCPELDRKSNLAVRASHLSDQLAVSGIEVKVASELLLIGVARVATVPRTLFVGQEMGWHGVRNSEVLRRSRN